MDKERISYELSEPQDINIHVSDEIILTNEEKSIVANEFQRQLVNQMNRVINMNLIPIGYKEIKNVDSVFISDNEIVVTGFPDEDDKTHNCDEMGCSSVSHVLFRTEIKQRIDWNKQNNATCFPSYN